MSKSTLSISSSKRVRSKIMFTDPSLAVHSQAYDTDINNMVKGIVPFSTSKRPSFYIDETLLPSSYEEQFNNVLAAQETFMMLPPNIREQFKNDPALLAKALADPRRIQELRDLGLLAPQEPSPAKPEPAKPAPKAPSDEGAPDA